MKEEERILRVQQNCQTQIQYFKNQWNLCTSTMEVALVAVFLSLVNCLKEDLTSVKWKMKIGIFIFPM